MSYLSCQYFNRASIIKSLEQLFLLGALTDDCKLSDPVGHQMARLPLDPIYSKSLIVASQFNCLEEMLITVAMLSVESIFYAPREKLDEVCALDTLMFSCSYCSLIGVLYQDTKLIIHSKSIPKILFALVRRYVI